MAKLTPLAKGLLSTLVVAVAGVAAWNIYQGRDGAPVQGTANASVGPVPVPHAARSDKVLGSADNPLKVSIVSFHGYAPALVANGNSLKTTPGSIYAKRGIHVEFLIQDDVPTLATIFGSGTAQCAWRTSDFWAQEHPNLRNAGLDGKAVVVVDNTQGGDAIIARDPSVQKVEDLAGRTVGLLQFTPSHGLLTDAIDSSSLIARKRQSIKQVFINADEGTAGVRAAFVSGNVNAAVLWDPDLSLALRDVPGAHVVYSTKTASNLIYDVMVCDSRVLDDAANDNALQQFVAGWLDGVDVARSQPDTAVDALIATEEFFSLLGNAEGKGFIRGLFENLVWTDLSDNARILGLVGGTNHYERVYKRFDQIYRAEGALANPNSPVINPQDSFDYRFVQRLLATNAQAKADAAKPTETYSDAERVAAVKTAALVTKPVSVNFRTGSAELTKRAQSVIDNEMVPFIENNGHAYFELSGHTDATGSAATNMRLSRQRAEAVARYLAEQWEIPLQRIQVAGYGSTRPICSEQNATAEGLSLDECRGINRSTRLAVYQR